MTATFTVAGVGSWTPALVTGDDLRRRPRIVVHELLDDEAPAVTILPTLLRSGIFEAVAKDPAQAAAGLALLSTGAPVTLTFPDRPDLAMRFIVGPDEIAQQTSTDTKHRAVVMKIPFVEVPA